MVSSSAAVVSLEGTNRNNKPIVYSSILKKQGVGLPTQVIADSYEEIRGHGCHPPGRRIDDGRRTRTGTGLVLLLPPRRRLLLRDAATNINPNRTASISGTSTATNIRQYSVISPPLQQLP